MIDASDMPAYANGQRYVYKGGPERNWHTDPDASWGHRSAVSTRRGGGFYGFKLQMACCTKTGPRGNRIAALNVYSRSRSAGSSRLAQLRRLRRASA